MTTDNAADTFGIVLPGGWEEFPVTVDGLQATTEALKTALRDDDAYGPTDERRVEFLLRRVRHELARGRVRAAGYFMQSVVRDDEDGREEIVIATVTVSTMLREDLGMTSALKADTLVFAMSGTRNDETSSNVKELEPPRVVSLPAGRAAHTVRLVETGDPRRGDLRLFASNYLVPFDDGERLCAVQFATPNIDLARDMELLFGGIARTLRIFDPSDETTFAAPGQR